MCKSQESVTFSGPTIISSSPPARVSPGGRPRVDHPLWSQWRSCSKCNLEQGTKTNSAFSGASAKSDESLTWTSRCSSRQIGPSPRSPYTVLSNGSLLLQPLSKDHHGGWECLATNRVATVSAGTVVFALGECIGIICNGHVICR